MIEEHYDNLTQRQQKIALREGEGLVMYHDDFDPDWKPGDEPHGTMIFSDPIPKTPEQIYQEQLAAEMNNIHEQTILAYKNWGSLTKDQKDTILKNLVKWALWKDGWLTLGVL